MDYGLRFLAQSSLTIFALCDADWAGCPNTRRSTAYVYIGANCVSWASKKQPTVSHSNAEAKYRSMASTATKLTWITYLFHDIGILILIPPQLLCDNLSALHMSINPVFHVRSKHIELDYHFVRGTIALRDLVTRFIRSPHQIADVFTKASLKFQFIYFTNKLRVFCLSLANLRGNDKQSISKHHLAHLVHIHALTPGHSITKITPKIT